MIKFNLGAIVSNTKILNTATIYLLNFEKKIVLPIDINLCKAEKLIEILNKPKKLRPDVYDTFYRTTRALKTSIVCIIIYKKQAGIYYSYIQLRKGDKLFEIDSKPSDAVALSLISKVPIYVLPKVYKKAGIVITEELVKKLNQ